MLCEAELTAVLDTVRKGLQQIASGSGYGSVTIQMAGGAPRDINVAHSLRYGRDVIPDEEKVPLPVTP